MALTIAKFKLAFSDAVNRLITAKLAETISVLDFGELTDDAAANTAILQKAINAANGSKLMLPAGDIHINAGVLTAVAGKRLHLEGQGQRATNLIVDGGSGFVFSLSNSVTLYNLKMTAPVADGIYFIGSDTQSLALAEIRQVEFVGGEVAIKYTGTGGWPLGSVIEGVYLALQTLAGILIDNSFSAGQGVHHWNNIVHIGTLSGSTAEQVAQSLVVTRDATPTTDTLTWAATNEKPYGWVVMRKPQGSTDVNSWVFVGTTNAGTRAYTASKSVGVQYDYFVVRRTFGLYLNAQEGMNISGAFGYCTDGVRLVSCRAITLSTYTEWRGQVLASPVGRFASVSALSTSGLNITHMWADQLYCGAHLRDCSGVISAGRFDNCTQSAVVLQSTARSNLQFGPFSLVGTPQTVYDDPAFNSSDYCTFTNNANATVMQISDLTESRFSTAFRGTQNASMYSDGTGGHFTSTGGHITWTPSPTNLTITGAVSYQATATQVGSYWNWSLRITATSGTFSSTAGSTTIAGLASLSPVPIAAGLNSLEAFNVTDITTLTSLGSGYVQGGLIRLPTFATKTDILISGRCKV